MYQKDQIEDWIGNMRNAASMIELIIAIVVMGIAVMTLPILLLKTQNNNAFTLQQEVILAARTKLGDTLTYRWDEASLQGDRIGVLVTNGDSDLNVTSDRLRRIGHVKGNKRRKFFSDLNTSTPVANLGPDTGDFNDVDDIDGQTTSLSSSSQTTSLDYRFTDFNISTTVVYVSDDANYSSPNMTFTFSHANVSHTTNIKLLTIKITGEGVTPFTMRSYSCNIGESELLRRSYN